MAAALFVTDHDGRRGVLDAPPGEGSVAVRLDSGEHFEIPSGLLAVQADGSYRLPASFAALLGAGQGRHERAVMPLAEERSVVSTRTRETGRVRLTRRVEQAEEVVEVPLVHESVEVVRVPADRFVDAPEPVRDEGGVTVIPVYEEVLVVEKRLRLKEELHVVRHRTEERAEHVVTLRRAHVDVERVGPEGHPTPPPEPGA